jgi:hypothetical protein
MNGTQQSIKHENIMNITQQSILWRIFLRILAVLGMVCMGRSIIAHETIDMAPMKYAIEGLRKGIDRGCCHMMIGGSDLDASDVDYIYRMQSVFYMTLFYLYIFI